MGKCESFFVLVGAELFCFLSVLSEVCAVLLKTVGKITSVGM